MLRKWDKIKLIGVVISLFLIFGGCGAGKVATNPDCFNTDNGLNTVEVFEKNFNENQLDSFRVYDRYINSDTTVMKKTYILDQNSDSTYNVIKRIRK